MLDDLALRVLPIVNRRGELPVDVIQCRHFELLLEFLKGQAPAFYKTEWRSENRERGGVEIGVTDLDTAPSFTRSSIQIGAEGAQYPFPASSNI